MYHLWCPVLRTRMSYKASERNSACMAHVLHAGTLQGMCAQHSKQGACAACWRLALNKEKLQLWPFSSLESEQLP